MTDYNTKQRRAWLRALQRPSRLDTILALALVALALTLAIGE